MVSQEVERDPVLRIFTDDDRPTFILKPKPVSNPTTGTICDIVFQNAALTSFIGKSEAGKQRFQEWASNFLEGYSPVSGLTRPQHVGTFGNREWTSHSLNDGRTLVYCRTRDWSVSSHNDTSAKLDTSYFSELASPDPSEEPEMPLTSLRVDWILYPDLPTDPWASFLRDFDWRNTAIGPMNTWPAQLRTHVITIMACQEPRVILWGENLFLIYNEAVTRTLGKAHPASLGQPYDSIWGSRLTAQHAQTIRQSLKQGKAILVEAAEAIVERDDYFNEEYYNFQNTPLTGEDGYWRGTLVEYTDVTPLIYQANREKVITSIGNTVTRTDSLASLWSSCMAVMEAESQDAVYGIVYSLENQSMDESSGLPPSANDAYAVQASFGIESRSIPGSQSLGLARIKRAQASVVLLQSKSNDLPSELAITVSSGTVCSAYVISVTSGVGATVAYVVLGMNPRRPIEESLPFAESLRDLFGRSVAQVKLPEDRARMEQANLLLLDQLRASRLKLEKNEDAIKRMGRNAPAGMFIFAADAQPIYANQAYFDIFGLSEEQFYNNGKSDFVWASSLYEEDHQSAKDTMMKAFVKKEPLSFEYRLVSPPNSMQRWMDGMIFPEMDENGNVTSFQGWVSDISHRKLAESIKEERLQEALDHKKAAERFLDLISHEIRNPLSSILLLADEILAMVPREFQDSARLTAGIASSIRDAAETVTLCALHQKNVQLRVVDDVLTLSKLDSRLFKIDCDRVRAPTIIEAGLKIMEPNFSKAGIESAVCVLPSYREHGLQDILMDSSRIKQVFINLLSNACKFTRRQAVRKITVTLGASLARPTAESLQVTLFPRRETGLEAKLKSDSESADLGNEVYIHFSVQDTGCGIGENEIHNLFHRFSQASPRTHKDYGGSGLGLFISREFVELHNGQIGIQSTPGVGSTFAFYIKAYRAETAFPKTLSAGALAGHEQPQTPPATKSPPSKPTSNGDAKVELDGLHVLVVEDNPVNQKVLSQQLRRAGCKTVSVADNGLECLNFLSATTFQRPSVASSSSSSLSTTSNQDSPKPLSVVLLDVEMPIMGGVACIQRIRELERIGELVRHVPVIAVTANARQQQRDDMIEAGMDEVQTKPFKIPDLLARMQALVARFQ